MLRAYCAHLLEDEGVGIEPVADGGVAYLARTDHVRAIGGAAVRTSSTAVDRVGHGERQPCVPDHHAIGLPPLAENAKEAMHVFTEGQGIVERARDAVAHIQSAVTVIGGGDQLGVGS